MASENPLRNLLIDCRIALRRVPPSDQIRTLGSRIDELIRDLDRGQLVPSTGGDEASTARSSSQQVALAWQTVCRGLMLSHPALHAELRARVMAMLDVRELNEPDQELLALEEENRRLGAELGSLRSRLSDMIGRAGQSQEALATLQEALAEAAADLPDAELIKDPQALSLARIDWLRQRPGSAPGPSAVAPALPPEQGPVPDAAVLRAVAAGEREFSAAQREWVIGEALGLTGWSMTPLELLAKGDVWLAEKIIAAAARG